MQSDLFNDGAEPVRSFPPHLDPARVSMVLVDREQDCDHVAQAVGGVLPVGALGNNRPCYVVRVLGQSEDVLHAESYPTQAGAYRYADSIRAALDRNRQADLFAS